VRLLASSAGSGNVSGNEEAWRKKKKKKKKKKKTYINESIEKSAKNQ
jgi:hypothetical protein